jgi:hypothetical protein
MMARMPQYEVGSMTVLKDLSQEQLIAMVQALQAKQSAGNGFKVTEKGGVSVYGLGRFPVTLYASQWENLFDKVEALKAFIATNKDKLAVKA